MNDRDAFERILASLYDAMLDDSHWPSTSALIDEACSLVGNALLVGEGPQKDLRARFVGAYYRGQHRPDLEREYIQVYHPIDEMVPRFRQLPDSHLVPVRSLYTPEEFKTSRAYNEIWFRGQFQNGLVVRLDEPDGSHLSVCFGDPLSSDGWGTSQVKMITRLLAAALPASGAVSVSGSMWLRRSSARLPLIMHVKPVGTSQSDYGARPVAALVLIVEPRYHHRIDPELVATTLGLTPRESQVAVWLAEGKSAQEMADVTGHSKGAIHWHLKQIYQKLHISGQLDLVRLVLSIAELG